MSSNVLRTTRAAASAVLLGLSALAWAQPAHAQSDEMDPEMRIQQLENQLRQLTGQNEELQYRNRQLEERLRALEGGVPAGPAASVQPNIAAGPPPIQPNPAVRQPQARPDYGQ